MAHQFSTSYIEDSVALFRYYKKLGEGAMAQLTDEQLFAALDPEMNSVAITVKHIAGNMRSRWTDFLTSDGEKPDRNRDCEFVDPAVSREALMKCWEDGWGCLFSALTPLTDADLERRVTIRGEPHSVMQADQPAGGALLVSRRADCVSREAVAEHELEVAERAHGTSRRSSIARWRRAKRASGESAGGAGCGDADCQSRKSPTQANGTLKWAAFRLDLHSRSET